MVRDPARARGPPHGVQPRTVRQCDAGGQPATSVCGPAGGGSAGPARPALSQDPRHSVPYGAVTSRLCSRRETGERRDAIMASPDDRPVPYRPGAISLFFVAKAAIFALAF